MIWYICFVLVLILLGITIKTILDNSKGQLRFAKALLLFIGVAFVLYIPIYFSSFEPIAAFFANLVNLFQLVSMDADYLNFYDEVAGGIEFGLVRRLYFALMGFVHVFMPLATIFTAFTVILHYLSDLRLFLANTKKNTVHVFSEFNDKSYNLAADIRSREPKAEIIFEKTDDNDMRNDVRDALRCIFRFDTITECNVKMKEDRKVYFYCISSDEEENLDSSLALIKKYSEKEDIIQRNISINVFSEAYDVESMLDSTEKKLLNVMLIKENYNCIYNLLDKHPLYESIKNDTVSVLIYGFGRLGKAMLKSALWAGQLHPRYNLEINVVGINLKEAESEIKLEVPGITSGRYNVHFHNCADSAECLEAVRKECRNTTYALVCCGTDGDNIRAASILRREFYAMDPEFRNDPPIYVYVQSHEKHKAVGDMRTPETRTDRQRKYNLTPFGDLQSIYTYENLTSNNLEKLAFNVHLVYTFGDSGVKRTPEEILNARIAYNNFEINKESSRANALHIRYKLWLLGLDYTDDPNAESVSLKDFLTEDMMRDITLSEHNRWEAYQVSEGWVTASLEQVKAYQKADLSAGRHNCPLLKFHPYICPFDQLEERSKALGLPDARFLDVKMIECIPLILNDNWGQAGKQYKIIKKDRSVNYGKEIN